ncbi:M30 family zinc metallopeptidase [Macrococcus armenti]|uniref:M30 family zinc metallopeptidase n=1 Tax=Macrococcus armenti TaxID=2875764 RepID=UPI001CD00E4B|nr:hypothetical protein [Macrococcus armenti]UBH08434.1 hypothetical protein LAU41_10720 [Macrococcus armenti]UBH10720.1 hypothetical protein LAU38_10920 [Macrococcus armenti]
MKKTTKALSSIFVASSLLFTSVSFENQVAHAVTSSEVTNSYSELVSGQSFTVLDGLREKHNLTFKDVSIEDNKVKLLFNYSSRSIIKEGFLNTNVYTYSNDLNKVDSFSENVKYVNSKSIEITLDTAQIKKNDGYIYLDFGASNKQDDFNSYLTKKFKVKLTEQIDIPEEPSTEEPTTEVPTTEGPTNEAPTTEEPTNETPKDGPGSIVVNNESMSPYYSKQPTGFSSYDESFIQQSLKSFKSSKPMMIDKNFELTEEELNTRNLRPNTSIMPSISKYEIGDQKSFITVNMEGNSERDEYTRATLQYKGSKALVWVADPNVTRADAEKLGREFDNNIAPLIHENFGEESDLDGNGKVNILLFDIKDGFGVTSNGYVGGYFHGRDLKPEMRGSNKMEIFYMDTYPSMGYPANAPKDITKIYSTVAHEFQHMVNFNAKHIEQSSGMDTYLNEAFSMAAEHIYNGPIQDRIDYYNNSRSIQNGHSLTYWTNAGDTLSNYSLSYLFGQYLNEQAGIGDKIYKEVIAYDGDTTDALQHVIHKYVSPTKSVGQFMTDFRIALIKKDKSGQYSLGNESEFQYIKTPYANSIPRGLYPQASVALRTDDVSLFQAPINKGEDIRYEVVPD